jgi:sugar O-acyltransferase (sialic acid O-acetyltransferase NeuD family)
MIIAGAKSHATEVIELFSKSEILEHICFFDDVNSLDTFFNKFKILNSLESVAEYFKTYDSKFVLGVGNPKLRLMFSDKLENQGGTLTSIISKSANIGKYNVNLSSGLNIMSFVFISNNTTIGRGTLINTRASIHHDVQVGEFCEISPNSLLLGGVIVGDLSSVGANATVLPNITIGSNVIIGAGAVVTSDLPDNCTAVGVPAKIIK